MKGDLLVITGFSGAGKGTVIANLMGRYPDYVFSVSATTRAPRPGEVDGREYFFITQEEYDKWVEEDRFLEHAGYVNHSYGTPRAYVEKMREEGKTVVLDIETTGAFNVKRACPEAKLVFLSAPSARELKNRLIGRGTESMEAVRGRLARAADECLLGERYDYFVINRDVRDCADEIHGIVRGESSGRIPMADAKVFLESFREDLLEILKNI